MRYKIIISKAGWFEIWMVDKKGRLLQLVDTVLNYKVAIKIGKGHVRMIKARSFNPTIRTAKLTQL